MKSASNNLVGLDNYTRPAEQETELNSLFLNVLNTKNGQKLMNYLKSITIEAVAGSEVSDATLRHLEGQRYLLSVIKQKIKRGQKNG